MQVNAFILSYRFSDVNKGSQRSLYKIKFPIPRDYILFDKNFPKKTAKILLSAAFAFMSIQFPYFTIFIAYSVK